MNPIQRALLEATKRLSSASDTPRLDAELLMAESLGIDRDRLLLDPPKVRPPARFDAMVERRLRGEPVAYITGRRAFWNIELHVGPGALIPRPDSEVLIASAIEHFAGRPPKRILDLGTGPGTLLLSALDIWTEARGTGIDASRNALSYAAANARRLGLDTRADLLVGDWGKKLKGRYDLILCNPPYVAEDASLGPGVREHEPHEALFAGKSGLDCIAVVAAQIPALLAPDGLAAVEIGHDQSAGALELLAVDGLQGRLVRDMGNRPRAILLTWDKGKDLDLPN